MARQTVADFLATSTHRRRAEIERLREVIRAADPALDEQIKWNAPSFGPAGADRITFRLQPGDRVELIFHRGAARSVPDGFRFEDPTGLMRMLAPDRGVVVFADAADVAAKAGPVAILVRAWLAATR